METDSVTCPQKSESQDECSSEAGKVSFTEDMETAIIEDHMKEKKDTDLQDFNKKDTEAITGFEQMEKPDSSFHPQPNAHPTSSPADGAVEPTREDLSSTVENDLDGDQGQEWPPVPGLEKDIQPEKNECQAAEIQDEVKENTETNVQASVQDTEGEEPVTMTQADKGTDSPQVPKLTKEEEGHELESHGDSDSIVFLSENSEELNIDCKPLDFPTTREQWVRRDSRCDEPPNLSYSKSSSKSLLTETKPSSIQSTSITESGVNAENVQQGELEVNNPSGMIENELVQQVFGAAPPLETVPGEPANPEPGNSACISTEVKESLIMSHGRRDSARDERECSETGEERKQTVRFTETGGTGGKQLEEVKDQRQERENKGQSAESQSNTKPHPGEGKVKRKQMDHFDDSQSDSGVSADFSPNSTTDVSEGLVKTDAPQPFESPLNETPIEREIRLAVKREQSLRRSRGLCDATDKSNEFVEIPLRRPILSQDLHIRPISGLDKDRQFAGKKMQKEISAETEREKVLVELGRLPGFYDKGTEVQLQEKKLLFESFQEPKESMAAFSRRSATNSTYVESAAGIQEGDSAVRQRLMQFSQNSATPPVMAQYGGTNSNPPATRGPGLTEGITGQIIIIEANSIPTTLGGPNGGYKTASRTDGGSVKVMNHVGVRASSAEPVSARQRPNLEVIEDEDSSVVKENPFFKLRSSMTLQPQVELDIKEAKERERELQRQRNSLYGGASIDLEEEKGTRMDLRTESGVKDKEILSSTPPWTNLTPTGRQSEMLTSTTSVRQSTGKLGLTWPPPQADEEQRQLPELISLHVKEQSRHSSKYLLHGDKMSDGFKTTQGKH
ncbi:uncharacterized protein misp3 isoform X1 [Megalobrama amblycephala]|uniref:uncharacterized protein misp3 isoform X1 n=1 Tax=Megalobrama amblycephala TaxID=75352 RepID=UPI0020147991|nr:uncharacterized protein misp3 isoform X1 [Megalobrama amblycephala]XP_048056325.1 uncharacterized protein misp3 isoform X1 [Megalobrama amblycephala]